MTAHTVFSVPNVDSAASLWFVNQEKASREADAQAERSGLSVTASRHTVRADLKGRDLLVALLSGEGWCSEAAVVYVAKPGGGRA